MRRFVLNGEMIVSKRFNHLLTLFYIFLQFICSICSPICNHLTY